MGGHLLNRACGRFYITATYHDNLISSEDVHIVAMDLDDERSMQHVVEQAQPQIIIHTAAWVHPDACEADSRLAHHRNAIAVEVLAEAAERLDARFIFCSTDMVFRGDRGRYSEDSETQPQNVYGRSKLMGEGFVRSICSNYVIARLALVYGRPLSGGNSFSADIRRRLKNGEQQLLFTDQFRSPVLVMDLANALLELAVSDFQGIIHVGGADRVDRYTFGRTMAQLHDLPMNKLQPVSIHDVKFNTPRPVDVSMDIRLAQSLLSTPLRGIAEGLKEA